MRTGIFISTITASLLLVGCGGGGTSSNTVAGANSTVGQGYYVDAAVAGVNYQCGSQTGVTDESGAFLFDKNQNCTFKLGDVVLREINATSLEHNVTILEDNTQVAQLLQTLDRDGNASNGIDIIEETHEVLKEQNITKVPKNIALLIAIKDKLKEKAPTKYKGEVISEQEVLAHLDETRTKLKDEGKKTQYDVESEQEDESVNDNENNSELTRADIPNQNGNRTEIEQSETDNQNSNNGATERADVSNQNRNNNEAERPNLSNRNGNSDETQQLDTPKQNNNRITRPNLPNQNGNHGVTTRVIKNLPTFKQPKEKNIANNEVIITFKKGMKNSEAFKRLLEQRLGENRPNIKMYNMMEMGHLHSQNHDTKSLEEILKSPEFAPYVEDVAPNTIMHLATTNDTNYNALWAIENRAQTVNGTIGTADADMDVTEAWAKTTGTQDVVVAVLDTGIDYTHSDLRENMWQGNVNHGYDFAADNTGANDDNPMPDLPYDVNGHFHGTHVAGIIGAVANNNEGISGVAQHVSIMALKVFRPDGNGYTSDILEALDYVSQKIDEGENIVAINASYGATEGSQNDLVNSVIKQLGAKGVLFCAAAGNEASNNDVTPTYPANYDAENIIAVGASDQNDNLASFSNYGANSVDVVAPGTNILSTYPDNQYAYLQGTSMATPQVAGEVALIASYYPNSTVAERKAMILNGVDVKSALNAKVATNGRVNINLALGEKDVVVTNHAPVATNDNYDTLFETAKVVNVLENDSDVDNDELTIVNFTQPNNGKVELDNQSLLYTPNDAFSGVDNFEYTISDGELNATATVTVKVKEEPVNTAPIANDDEVKTAFETAVTFDVLANDSDAENSELSIKSFTETANGSLILNNGKFTYTPQTGFSGEDGFKYVVTDGIDDTTGNVKIVVAKKVIVDDNNGSNNNGEDNNSSDDNQNDNNVTTPHFPDFPDMEHNITRPDFPRMDNNRTRPDFPDMEHNMTRPDFPRMDNNRTRPDFPDIGGDNQQDNNKDNPDVDSTTFTKALAIPALAPYKMVEGYKVFDLDINESTTEFFDGVQTKTLGINANILGQTIRIHNGDDVKLVYHNNLDEPTTMHGHGMHVPAIMDGGPINKIQPHTSWTAQYTVNQEACTNWYHPHLMGKTVEQVYHGLAGVIIIDDDLSDALDLPKTYGVDDIPVVLQDKFFDENGQIDYSPSRMQIMRGYTGGYMLANGVINPHLDVPAKKVRFRLLNGSNGSLYRLEFTDKHEFYQIATDNSFLEEPVKMTQVVLTPGERAEIVVDFSNDLNKSFVLKDLTLGKEIMKINVNKLATTHNQLPTKLTTLEKLNPANAVRTRKFVLGMNQGHMTINGKSMDMMRIDELVPENDVEIWEITNMMGMEHNFHIHATHFLPLERNGSPANLTPAEHGYKDVIRLAGKDNVKVIVKMTDFPDEKTGYMYHCHFLEHEDDGMMGQFAITTGKVAVNVGGTTSNGMNRGGNNNQNRNRRGRP